MIARDLHVERITSLLKRFPVVAILGARQVGKTTLASLIAPSVSDRSIRFDLFMSGRFSRVARHRRGEIRGKYGGNPHEGSLIELKFASRSTGVGRQVAAFLRCPGIRPQTAICGHTTPQNHSKLAVIGSD